MNNRKFAYGSIALVAQLAERQSCKLEVSGSIPGGGFLWFAIFYFVPGFLRSIFSVKKSGRWFFFFIASSVF